MALAVEMFFDAQTEANVRQLWDTLARAGITSYLIERGSRPHISLAVAPAMESERLRSDLEDFAWGRPSLPVRLGSVGLFRPAGRVMYLAPVVTGELLEMHREYHGRLERLGVEAEEHYRQGQWTPHCTAGMHIEPDKIDAAVATCLQGDVFATGRLTEIGLVDLEPKKVEFVCTFAFGGDF